MYLFGVYRGVWRYVDFDDLARFLQASLGAGILLAAVIFGLDSTGWVTWTRAYSHLLLALFGVFLFLGLVLIALFIQIPGQLGQQTRPAG